MFGFCSMPWKRAGYSVVAAWTAGEGSISQKTKPASATAATAARIAVEEPARRGRAQGGRPGE